jgi:hypothetical protein
MVPRPRDRGVEDFLTDHVKALLKLAGEGASPHARFQQPDPEAEFDRLRTGTDQDFLDAAGALTRRLISEMDGRSAPGLLVCIRLADGAKLSAAALKLQVVTPNAAVLQALDTGEEVLSAARNVLDAPGELQKGALVVDPRHPDSDVVVGDKLTHDAQYFPRAYGIRTEQRAKDGGADLLNALSGQLAPTVIAAVARVLPALPSGNPTDVLDAARATVPELTDHVRSATVAALQAQPRPVTRIATDAPLKQVITADGITISGTVSSMQAVQIEQRPDGEYRITVDVSEQPHSRFKR